MKRIKSKTKHRQQKKQDKTDYSNYSIHQLAPLLKDSHRAFAREYVKHYNRGRAYRKVYGDHLEQTTCYTNGSVLLKNTKIVRYVQLLEKNIDEAVGISKIGMLTKLKNIAEAQVTDILGDDWITRADLETIKKNHPEICEAIAEVSTKVVQSMDEFKTPIQIEYVKLKFHNKLQAIADIMKARGWNEPDKIAITVEQPLFPDLD